MKKPLILAAFLFCAATPGAWAACATYQGTTYAGANVSQYPVLWGFNASLRSGAGGVSPVTEDPSCNLNVNIAAGAGAVVSTSPKSFQQTLAASAAALASNAYTVGIVITALTTNTGTVYVGGPGVTASTGYPMVPGQSISYAVSNSNLVYVIGTNTTDQVAVTGN